MAKMRILSLLLNRQRQTTCPVPPLVAVLNNLLISASSGHPPIPPDDQCHVEDIKEHQPSRLDQGQLAIRQATDQDQDGQGEEADVPDEGPSGDLEGLDERHAADDHGDDEA